MSLGLVIEIVRLAVYHDPKFRSMVRVTVLAVALVLSDSSTGLLIAVACGCVVLILSKIARARAAGTLQFALLVGVPMAVVALWSGGLLDLVLAVTGKDPTLTNRTFIWHYVWIAIENRFWLGYGYAGFWTGGNGPDVIVWQGMGTQIAHAHDGFLDIWLQMGVVGVALIVVALLLSLVLGLRKFMRTFSDASIIGIVLTLFVIFYSLDESNLFNYNSIYALLIFMALFGLEPASRGLAFSRGGKDGAGTLNYGTG